jgi:hypothetical protein
MRVSRPRAKLAPSSGHLTAYFYGGEAISGDGSAEVRSCSRVPVTELPATFSIPKPPTLTDTDYAVTAAVFLGDDEVLSIGDFGSSIFDDADPANFKGISLWADPVHDCADMTVGGLCTTRRR